MDFIFVGAGNLWAYIKQDWKSNRVRLKFMEYWVVIQIYHF